MAALRIIVVGGVAGGASAATRARRMNEAAEIIIFEKGEHISFANCGLPYYIGEQIKDRAKLLVSTPREFADRYRIDVRTHHEVLRIDRENRQVEVLDHRSGRRDMHHYDKLILAPGASPIIPDWAVPDASNAFTLRDLADTDRIKAFVDQQKPTRAVVIGGGYIGIEMTEVLAARGIAVSLVEARAHVMPLMDDEMGARIESVLRENGIDVRAGKTVRSLAVRNGKVAGVVLADGDELAADMVVLAIGVQPNVKLAVEAGLRIGSSGGIAVDGCLQTSDPDILAVGDAAEAMHLVVGQPMRIPLAGPANRYGRLAGQRAATGDAPSATPVAGTSIVGFFGKAAGMTGLSVRVARQLGMECAAVFAIGGHHAGYYPGAEQMVLKLVFDPKTRRVLGAQAIGGGGVDKRLDVIATALRFQATIDDLAGLDLAYAPQFGSAKDLIHMAAFIAQDQSDGLVRQIQPGDPVPAGQLLDVRTEAEVQRGTLPGAINIPLQRLRENLMRLDRSQPVVLFCGVGMRGYVAARILQQSGFNDVWNLAGGYTLQKDTWADSLARSTGRR